MRLLVFGGAGHIGSVVSARLLAAGHDVILADNVPRGTPMPFRTASSSWRSTSRTSERGLAAMLTRPIV